MIHHNHTKKTKPAPGSMQGWGKYYDLGIGMFCLGQEAKFRQATLDLIALKPGDAILEVGCGTGTLALAAKRRTGMDGRIDGIDPAPDMIDIARAKAAKNGLEAQFRKGSIEAIPFPENTFDFVLSSAMMHHVPAGESKRKGFEEVFRVLKPGGEFLIVDFEPPRTFPLKQIDGLLFGREFLLLNVRTYITLFECTGFIEIRNGLTKFKAFAFLIGKKP